MKFDYEWRVASVMVDYLPERTLTREEAELELAKLESKTEEELEEEDRGNAADPEVREQIRLSRERSQAERDTFVDDAAWHAAIDARLAERDVAIQAIVNSWE